MNNLSTFKNTLSFVFIIVLLSSCQPSKSPQSDKEDFVYVENKIFKIKQDTFFPMMLNYVIDFRDINNDLFVSASKNYENPDTYEYETKEESLKQLSIHFRLIKQLGFNTLRICMDRVDSDRKGNYFYKADNKKYFIKKEGRKITQALQECIDIAQDNDLKVMLLIKPPINNKDLENFTIQLLKKFYNQPTIFAYDFMNEPLYFDHEANRKKKDAVRIVNRWKELMSLHAPNQLLTIGFSEPIEVFEWDPSILAVDFVQVHTYHPLRVPNEIYWYSQYIDKAWMIGETALPADNDSISYEMQRQFIIDAFNYTVDCGGCGFGWWEFQEVKNTHFEAQYTGLLNHDSITLCDNYQLIGTLKPAAYEVASLKNHKKQKAKQAVNYYNMMGYKNICIKGKIINKTNNQAIEGAVIRGWNKDWSVGMNTFTNAQGEFTLYSNDECVRFEISAPGMTKVKFNKNITYNNKENKPINIENLTQKDLEYHQISFMPFLTDSSFKNTSSPYPIFDFKPQMFKQAKLKGNMGVIYLESLK